MASSPLPRRFARGSCLVALLATPACFVDGGIGPTTADAVTTSTMTTTTGPSGSSTSLASTSGDPGTGGDPTTTAAGTTIDTTTTGCAAQSWYADADGDGYGDPAHVTFSCEAPPGTVANADDCDDAHASALPGGVEVCDQLDNNCDGVVDEYGSTNQDLCNGCRRFVTPTRLYDVCEGPTGWDAARSACQGRKGDLAAFEAMGEQEAAVQATLLAGTYWIGLDDGAQEGTFVWVGGAPLTEPHWDDMQPDNADPGENCVELRPNLLWNDADCGVGDDFLCEIPR